jgi:hypothetical protein
MSPASVPRRQLKKKTDSPAPSVQFTRRTTASASAAAARRWAGGGRAFDERAPPPPTPSKSSRRAAAASRADLEPGGSVWGCAREFFLRGKKKGGLSLLQFFVFVFAPCAHAPSRKRVRSPRGAARRSAVMRRGREKAGRKGCVSWPLSLSVDCAHAPLPALASPLCAVRTTAHVEAAPLTQANKFRANRPLPRTHAHQWRRAESMPGLLAFFKKRRPAAVKDARTSKPGAAVPPSSSQPVSLVASTAAAAPAAAAKAKASRSKGSKVSVLCIGRTGCVAEGVGGAAFGRGSRARS